MSGTGRRVVYEFGEFSLDPYAYELRHAGQRIHLARQPMDVLLRLVDTPGDLVLRDEIAALLWRDEVFVDVDTGVRTIVRQIRRALSDDGRHSRHIETVAGKGYRFIAPVRCVPRNEPLVAIVSAAPVRGSPARRDHLPADLTSFVGRQRELQTLASLLDTSRLLTLTGSGGVGKTRLALRLASTLADRFADGAWMVDLGALTGPEFLAETIAATLGLRERRDGSARQVLAANLWNRELLLILDTCEHVVTAAAEMSEMLLREAPALRIVATSREALSVPGEVIFRVPSLALPGERVATADAEAVRLFLDRAGTARHDFSPTAADLETVARICRRVEGIPLAIELAAARVVVLSLDQIESRLRDRFQVLTGGARTLAARQQTLEATIGWSYQLLSAEERTVLKRLSVFPASWTFDAAEHVCGGDPLSGADMLRLLTRLVDKSLAVPADARPEQRRHRLLDTVREYAGALLAQDGPSDALRARHYDYFHSSFADSQALLRGPRQLRRLEELRVEHENVRAALDWGFRSGRAAAAAELAGAVAWYWTKRGLFEEGKRWLERAVAIAATPHVHARALYGLAHMHHFQGDQRSTLECGRQLECVGIDTGDVWSTATGRFMQSLAAFELGEFDLAIARASASLHDADMCGEPVERGGPLMVLANVALARGDQETALGFYEAAVVVHRQSGDLWGLSILLSITAGLRLVRGEVELARRSAAEALAHCRALDDPRGIAWSLEVFAGLCAAGGDAELAARLWGLSESLLMIGGGALTATIGWIRDRHLELTQRSMGDAAFAAAREAGRRWTVDEAMPRISAVAGNA